MSKDNKYISVSKAKVHNLKSVSVEIPRDQITVITGPSGSGKSSLAFDTIYAEGQRRYIESLSSYARQFLGQYEAPDVESISGLSPTIAIDQKTSGRNPRSTVGTVTEIYDYLRVLYARIGVPHSPKTGKPMFAQSAQQIVKRVLDLPQGSKLQILAPIVRGRKGEHKEELSQYLAQGFSRIRLDGTVVQIDDDLKITKNQNHHIDLVIDRLVLKEGIAQRLTDSVEYALKIAKGYIIVLKDEEELFFTEKFYDPESGESFPELEPRLFSFNSPIGACPDCNGLGETKVLIKDLVILDPNLSINDGAIGPLAKKSTFLYSMLKCVAKEEKVSLDEPLKKLPIKFKNILFEGTDKVYTYSFKSENSTFNFKKAFPGIMAWLQKKYHESESEKVRVELEKYMRIEVCPDCKGERLNRYARSVKINGQSIMQSCALSIDDSYSFFSTLKLGDEESQIAEKLLKEIKNRLKFLLDVGLNYLTLNRSAVTLSGGESQRIRLATQIGSALTGVLYVLDEPSIGLHQRDNDRLINTLKHLKNLGNTILVVEHDEDTMMAADHIIDMGPGAGIHGGEIIASGTAATIMKNSKSPTGQFLSKKVKIEVPKIRRDLKNKITIKGANSNNLKKLDVEIPLCGLICVTGVSGSGKSSLIHSVLVPNIREYFDTGDLPEYLHHAKAISGLHHLNSLIELDQSPIGRTPHSNPATYTGLFDDIRTIFSSTNEAKVRGYKPGRFSFNVKGGRCESCEGNGVKKIEMHFLSDVYVTCSECNGSRYNNETLSVLYKGRNIADILKMSIEEAHDFFANHPRVERILKTLLDVGLGYMALGQSATTLSGGEAQRMKLARELAKRVKGSCLYVLDEPTTGLHFQDIKMLLSAINQLIELGHTVLVIEHNLDVIKTADYIIDLGPEGGKNGGEIVATGTPEEVVKVAKSFTGKYLKKYL
ncbi:MAG: excinuclease ABC subunit UvrA [Bacteriovoracaceae bacterium]